MSYPNDEAKSLIKELGAEALTHAARKLIEATEDNSADFTYLRYLAAVVIEIRKELPPNRSKPFVCPFDSTWKGCTGNIGPWCGYCQAEYGIRLDKAPR